MHTAKGLSGAVIIWFLVFFFTSCGPLELNERRFLTNQASADASSETTPKAGQTPRKPLPQKPKGEEEEQDDPAVVIPESQINWDGLTLVAPGHILIIEME